MANGRLAPWTIFAFRRAIPKLDADRVRYCAWRNRLRLDQPPIAVYGPRPGLAAAERLRALHDPGAEKGGVGARIGRQRRDPDPAARWRSAGRRPRRPIETEIIPFEGDFAVVDLREVALRRAKAVADLG